jgi:hypothetical protein
MDFRYKTNLLKELDFSHQKNLFLNSSGGSRRLSVAKLTDNSVRPSRSLIKTHSESYSGFPLVSISVDHKGSTGLDRLGRFDSSQGNFATESFLSKPLAGYQTDSSVQWRLRLLESFIFNFHYLLKE